mgnify:CR=1 FL=1
MAVTQTFCMLYAYNIPVDPLNLNRLGYFAAVAELGSFTRAADRLGITKAVVSQQVARLERELKANLFVRTTRKVGLTEAGRMLQARCVSILSEAEAAARELGETNATPTGTLRVGGPYDYGTSVLAPVAAAFSRKHPDCRVQLVLSDRRLDPLELQVDLSIRVGWLADSSLHTRRLATFRQLLVASPGLKLSLKTPSDLATAPFVANEALTDPFHWRFSRGAGEKVEVRMRNVAASVNVTAAVLAATLAGAGAAILPEFLIAGELRSGRLVPLLPRWTLPAGGIHIVYSTPKFRPAKIRAFEALLAERIAEQAGS